MGTAQIKMDIRELQATLQTLQSSIDEFSSYTDTFRTGTRNQLKNFHSDFIDKVDAILDHMNNDVNKELVKNMHAVYTAGKSILEEMTKADEEIGKDIRSGQS
ncbi:MULTISPECIES: hypothetical protein [Niallia]|uniref:hypothetical protein n=2 Tax=Bacillaceae TaxID=186817 RepID=UPI000F447994|nr:hypothetical protein [Niallia circulans]AYV66668.1 hypothetical protein C2I06_07140 [Niallia circulans]AYV70210.1 hypothetical protein C2H98_00735 [Niallia circulans]QJX62558.1 hypothetical protein HLK66_13460 [Niallia circulans]QJX62818.1 hypothetical protein HLK66_14935 [Niallia circulans]UQZ77285.1 hypothetical protein C2I17_23535 [Niallia circulans]